MNPSSTPTQEIETIERNPIGLPSFAAKEVSDHLDVLVSSISLQFHQYLKHHWVVEGPEHRDLHKFFEELYEQSKQHMDAIAERMTTLGAVPTASPQNQILKSVLSMEPEGAHPIRAMLEGDLNNEQTLITHIRSSIEQTNQLGDYGTETLLKGILMDRENDAHEIEHYLSSDSLNPSEGQG